MGGSAGVDISHRTGGLHLFRATLDGATDQAGLWRVLPIVANLWGALAERPGIHGEEVRWGVECDGSLHRARYAGGSDRSFHFGSVAGDGGHRRGPASGAVTHDGDVVRIEVVPGRVGAQPADGRLDVV